MQEEFFIQHPKSNPTIYAYVLPGVPSHEGFVKVGYTGRDVTERINEQTHTVGVSAQERMVRLFCAGRARGDFGSAGRNNIGRKTHAGFQDAPRAGKRRAKDKRLFCAGKKRSGFKAAEILMERENALWKNVRLVQARAEDGIPPCSRPHVQARRGIGMARRLAFARGF